MSVRKFGAGQSVRRVADLRLVTGQGRYATDACQGAALHAAFVRSPHGHARFRLGDRYGVRAAPGVRAVCAAADFAGLGDLPGLAPGAPLVFASAPGNAAYDTAVGDEVATDTVVDRAPRRVGLRIVNPRVVANDIELCAARADGAITLELGGQGVHIVQKTIE